MIPVQVDEKYQGQAITLVFIEVSSFEKKCTNQKMKYEVMKYLEGFQIPHVKHQYICFHVSYT